MTSPNKYDVVVAGGGPAGCAAALALRRLSPQARILLLERGKYPRHKVCGEFVSVAGVEALEHLTGTGPAISKLLSVSSAIALARLFVDGSELALPVSPAAISIPRYTLDAALWDACRAAGIECREQTVAGAPSGPAPFHLLASDQPIEALALVDASGRWSNLSTRPAPQEKWIGIKAHFAESAPAPSVDLYFVKDGYCGVQPVDGSHVNVCAMVLAAAASDLSQVVALHPRLRERSRSWQRVTADVTTSPLLFAPPEPWRAGIFRVGDAAGFIDPFLGDGITLALVSGELAAGCIAGALAGECTLTLAGERYAREYKEKLAPVFRRAAWLRRLLRSPRALRNGALRILRIPGLARGMVERTRAS